MRVRASGSRSKTSEPDRSQGSEASEPDRSQGSEASAPAADPTTPAEEHPTTPADEPVSPGAGKTAASPDPTLRDALRPSGPPRIAMTAEHQPGAVVVHVDGELDLLTAPKLGARLNGVILSGTTDLVLDLRDVQFMDSSGLQLLMTTRRRLLRDSRELSVVCADGPVRRVIEMARLTEALRVTTG